MAADPYLAVTLDAKRRIAQAARALDQPHPGPAAWGLLELLEDVWRRKDPAVSALVLAACFGPDQRWPAALVAFRFLIPAPAADSAGWALHPEEADRLLLTHAKRVAAGKARAGGAKRDRHGRLQHITSTSPAVNQRATSGPPAADQLLQPAASSQQPAGKKKKLAGTAPADPPAVAEPLALVPTEPDEKPPRRRSEGQQFWSWYQDGRTGNTGLVREAEPEAVALNAWLKRAVGEVGMQRLYTAAAKFVKAPKDEYWKSRGFPFLGFMTDNVWRQYVPPEERSG